MHLQNINCPPHRKKAHIDRLLKWLMMMKRHILHMEEGWGGWVDQTLYFTHESNVCVSCEHKRQTNT